MLDKDIKNILKTELAHYSEYKLKLNAFYSRVHIFGLNNAGMSEYMRRIEAVCLAVDFVMNNLDEPKRKLVREVYIHRTENIKRFAVMNYIDLSSAYRWANEFFVELALELGYLDKRCVSLPEPYRAKNA